VVGISGRRDGLVRAALLPYKLLSFQRKVSLRGRCFWSNYRLTER
jgi:hypothetical protein